jgi:hypothetical protein
MGILGGDDGFFGANQEGSENNFVASLGRISGKLLAENLQRNGVDLAFNTDLLYLKVSPIIIGVAVEDGEDGDPNYDSTLPAALSGTGIGVNIDTPIYDLDVNNTMRGIRTQVTNLATIDNITFNANGTIGSTVGPIEIVSSNADGIINYAEILSDYLSFNDNYIASISNQNIKLDPNGTGRVVFDSNARITGNLSITGNIQVNGDLTQANDIIIGDQPLDTVTVNTDFSQSIIPGTDITYDLGTPIKRWDRLYSPDLAQVVTMLPNRVLVSDQIDINGLVNKISGIQSNEDISLLPDTGIVYIERTKWQDNTITNLNDTPLIVGSTGIGYTVFAGTNAMLIPAGTNAERRPSPEIGETRWNTTNPTNKYLECFDGTVWAVSTGGGIEVDVNIMEDLSHVWILTLG